MKTLMLGIALLGCCLAAAAQVGSNPNQAPPTSTPPTFPQDQTGQVPSNPSTPSEPSAIPPDTHAPGAMAQDASQAASSQQTSLEGCLSRTSDGNFILADNSGNSFQLRGSTSQLSDYVGKEIKVNGIASPSSAGAMSSSTSSSSTSSSSSTPANRFNVSNVQKIADSCPPGASSR